MTDPSSQPPDPNAGTARLPVVVIVAIITFFYTAILDYLLPLYFGALSEAAVATGGSYPADLWSKLVMYRVTPWIVGPTLAGLLARRYGERLVWCGALLGEVVVPFTLVIDPDPVSIRLLALWQGCTGSLMWISGISLVQMVAPGRKGLSNGLMMTSLGAGSLLGSVFGRALLNRHELGNFAAGGHWTDVWRQLFAFQPMTSRPLVVDFELVFWLMAASTFTGAILVGVWGQRKGRYQQQSAFSWDQTLKDLALLVRNSKFWGLVIALCLLGGPMFQASNQFLPYRAQDIGLITGSQDQGWIWLQLLRTLMWIPGGAAVGLLAGRRAAGIAAVLILISYALSTLAIGLSAFPWQLFLFVATFEFVRQFMRWSHAGYLSEHFPGDLRSTAIGVAITFSGLGNAIYGWTADALWDPATQSSLPFYTAATIGIIGSIGLFIFDRFRPIRERNFGRR